MLFLISYKFTDANAQEKGSKMLKEWYDKGGPQNRPEGYEVKKYFKNYWGTSYFIGIINYFPTDFFCGNYCRQSFN